MSKSSALRTKFLSAACVGAVAIFFGALSPERLAAEEGRVIPAPKTDESTSEATEVAVLAGGCFWGVQGVFEHLEGVSTAMSGYAGGEAKTAHYATVSSGSTGHAEVVQITFDPRRISYGHILQIYFAVAHDPTQRDRQGSDRGTQYRSAIFPANAEQERVARAYIAQLDEAHVFDAVIATKVERDRAFYPAEGYHQDFMMLNPSNYYIAINDMPKVERLKRLFPGVYRSKPVLVPISG